MSEVTTIDPAESVALFKSVVADERWLRGAWHQRRDGKDYLCLAAAWGKPGTINGTEQCPTNLFPAWLFELMPMFDDNVAPADVPWLFKGFAARADAMAKLDSAAWDRIRRARNSTPAGAVYVGRPTIWLNPFGSRPRIGHKRSVILFSAWLAGHLSPRVLAACGFGPAERQALGRRRHALIKQLPALRGRDLQCWCPVTSDWCHADVLIRIANR